MLPEGVEGCRWRPARTVNDDSEKVRTIKRNFTRNVNVDEGNTQEEEKILKHQGCGDKPVRKGENVAGLVDEVRTVQSNLMPL